MRLILTSVIRIHFMSRLPNTSVRLSVLLCALLAALLGGILAACAATDTAVGNNSETASSANGVLVTTSIWADVVATATCATDGAFRPLIPPGADPHEYQPSIADAEAVQAASVIIANGGGLEESLETLVDQAESDGVTVIRLIEAIDAPGVDPHLWLDPTLTIEATQAIADVVVAAGVDGDAVADCADRYVATLEDLDVELAERIATLAPDQRKLVTNHDALGRYADHYGFEIIGTVLPSTSSMAQEGEDAEALADRLGVEAVRLQTDALGPGGSGFETYVDLMRTNTELIVAALGDGA